MTKKTTHEGQVNMTATAPTSGANDGTSRNESKTIKRHRVGKKRRKKYNALMKMIRRLHMYFGLILVPFVLLYGITAMLFNHYTWFSNTVVIENERLALASVAMPSADDVADQVIADLIQKSGLPVQRADGNLASYTSNIIVDFSRENDRVRYRIDPNDMSSKVHITHRPSQKEAERIFPDSLESRDTETVPALLSRLEELSEGQNGRIRRMPDVQFNVMLEGEEWILNYDLRSGELSQRRPADPSSPFSLRSFLLRLHTSHGYPDKVGSRMFWAIIVDLMAALMVFWGLSGLFMWWQMRPTRRIGIFAVTAGLILSSALGYGMLQSLYY